QTGLSTPQVIQLSADFLGHSHVKDGVLCHGLWIHRSTNNVNTSTLRDVVLFVLTIHTTRVYWIASEGCSTTPPTLDQPPTLSRRSTHEYPYNISLLRVIVV